MIANMAINNPEEDIMKNQTETIDITPTWEETALMLLAIIEGSSDAEALAYAKSEIIRMGKIIDHLKSQQEVTA